MNTKCIMMSAKNKAKWEKAGAVVSPKTNLPPHLAAIVKKRADDMAQFDLFEVTLDLDKVDDNHPIHAMV